MIKINFSEDHPFNERSINFSLGTTGIYFIFLENLSIPYPVKSSRLIYIGMSESIENSIGRRLKDHLSGHSGNRGLKNYAQKYPVRYSFYSKELLQNVGTKNLFEIENLFLESFMSEYGAFPICNSQSGRTLETEAAAIKEVEIDWEYFS